MNNEIKEHYSISLENGITITGKDPYFVMGFLTTLESCLYWATEHYAEYELIGLHDECKTLQEQVSKAAMYISEHLQIEKEK